MPWKRSLSAYEGMSASIYGYPVRAFTIPSHGPKAEGPHVALSTVADKPLIERAAWRHEWDVAVRLGRRRYHRAPAVPNGQSTSRRYMAEMAIVSFLRISKPPYLQYRRPTDEAQSQEHLPLGEDCADPVFLNFVTFLHLWSRTAQEFMKDLFFKFLPSTSGRRTAQ